MVGGGGVGWSWQGRKEGGWGGGKFGKLGAKVGGNDELTRWEKCEGRGEGE